MSLSLLGSSLPPSVSFLLSEFMNDDERLCMSHSLILTHSLTHSLPRFLAPTNQPIDPFVSLNIQHHHLTTLVSIFSDSEVEANIYIFIWKSAAPSDRLCMIMP